MADVNSFQICSVFVDNLFDGEIVGHKLLYVRGRIICNETNKLHIMCNGERVEFMMHDKHFRFFVELKLGRNVIEFLPEGTRLNVLYQPSTCERFLRVLLIVLTDKTSQSESFDNLRRKVSLTARLVQCFVAEELRAKFGTRKTFRFEVDDDINVCRIFHSKFCEIDFNDLSNEEIYWKFAKEIIQNHDNRDNAKYLTVLSCTKYLPNDSSYLSQNNSWEDILNRSKFYINYSIGHVAVVHGGGLESWPVRCEDILNRFLDKTKLYGTTFFNDSAGRDTIGGVYATTFGTVVHELGHIFNLAHTSNGIMGRGFDNIQLAFVDDLERETIAEQNKCRHNRRIFSCQRDKEVSNENVEILYHFADSSLVILNNHQWFNNYSLLADNVIINQQDIQSNFGLCLAELRTDDGEAIICWDLNVYKPKRWSIPVEIKQNTNTNLSIFVMNIFGVTKSFSLN